MFSVANTDQPSVSRPPSASQQLCEKLFRGNSEALLAPFRRTANDEHNPPGIIPWSDKREKNTINILVILIAQLKTATFSPSSRFFVGATLLRFSHGGTSLTSLSIFQLNRRLMVEFPWCLEIFTTRRSSGELFITQLNLSKSQASKISVCKVELRLAHVGQITLLLMTATGGAAAAPNASNSFQISLVATRRN